MTQIEFLKAISTARGPAVTIAVSSGKGGVGKTTLSIAISKLLSDRGKRVYLLDADLGLANVDVILGLSPQKNLYHVATGEASLEEVLIKVKENLWVIPGGSGIRELLNMDVKMRGRIALDILKLSNKADYIIVDTGAGISDDVLLFCVSCRHNIIVVTPEPPSLTDAYALMKILNRDYSKREFKIIVNMADRSEGTTTFKYLETVTSRFLGNTTLIKLGEVPRHSAFQKMVLEQNIEVMDGAKEILNPLAEKLISTDLFPPEEGALARLAMGILRFKGAKQTG